MSTKLSEAALLSHSAFHLILASGSARRRELLTDAGFLFSVLPPRSGAEEDAEASLYGATPELLVKTLARTKAQDVVSMLLNGTPVPRLDGLATASIVANAPLVVLACDSVAVCDGEILGKPVDRADAERMLRKLSGSRHSVVTGLCLALLSSESTSRELERVETSTLQMDELSEEQLSAYLASNLWQGKAGAFGYQDGNSWLELLSGEESNVVGLPLEALAQILVENFSA